MSNSKIRNNARIKIIDLLNGGAANGDLNLEVKALIMLTEILDEYLEETLRSNKVIEGLLKDILAEQAVLAEIKRSFAPATDRDQDRDQDRPGRPGPGKDSAGAIVDVDKAIAEAKTEVIKRHAARLPDGLTRQQIISSAKTFVDWIKIDLARALDCRVSEVPVKLLEWIENTQSKTAKDEENTGK